MFTNKEVRETGRTAFKANYWPCVLVSIILSLFAGYSGYQASSNSGDISSELEGVPAEEALTFIIIVLGILAVAAIIGILLKIFLFNPLQVGSYAFFKENIKSPAPLSTIKVGFQNYGRTFITLFLRDLFIVLWCILLIIPGIVKAYSYALVPYILADNPELSPMDAIKRSKEMMNGYKMQAFLLDLSFIGWILLGCITAGIALIFWTCPYMYSSDAAFYLKVKEAYGNK